jgi:hypothetical protein
MKKFILLFAIATMCFSVTEAQKITKIFGRNDMYFPEVVDFDTDTFRYVAPNSIHIGRNNVNVYFSVLFENGDIPLKKGNIIVLDLKLETTSIFGDDNDSLHYTLTNDLDANDTLRIDWNDKGFTNVADPGYSNLFVEIDEFRDRTTLIATVFRTSNGVVPSPNREKQLTAYFLRYLKKPYNTERAMQNIQIYPNPIKSNLNITNLSNTKVEVFNVVGQQIIAHENANGNLRIDMTSYPNGIYFVKMQSGKAVRTEKIKLIK